MKDHPLWHYNPIQTSGKLLLRVKFMIRGHEAAAANLPAKAKLGQIPIVMSSSISLWHFPGIFSQITIWKWVGGEKKSKKGPGFFFEQQEEERVEVNPKLGYCGAFWIWRKNPVDLLIYWKALWNYWRLSCKRKSGNDFSFPPFLRAAKQKSCQQQSTHCVWAISICKTFKRTRHFFARASEKILC